MHRNTARYTKEAARVVFFARYEASSAGCSAIEPQHLLLALIREAKPLFDDPAAIKAEIEKAFPAKVSPERPHLPLSEAGKRVFENAAAEADHSGSYHIEPKHLLLGILREGNFTGCELLDGRSCQWHNC